MKLYSQARAAAVLAMIAMPVALPLGALAQTTPTAKTHTPNVTSVLKNSSANVEAHITLLHKELQITPAEEPQWTAFAQVMRDNAAQMDAAFSQRGQAFETMNAVQDMQSYAQVAQVQSDNMQKLSAAFQTLYGSFPPAQQKVADGVFRPRLVKHQ